MVFFSSTSQRTYSSMYGQKRKKLLAARTDLVLTPFDPEVVCDGEHARDAVGLNISDVAITLIRHYAFQR